MDFANIRNSFQKVKIEEVSKYTHLSTISLYTRLLLNNKILPLDYKNVKAEILSSIEKFYENENKRRELEKQKAIAEGRKLQGSTPKPIISPLYLNTLQSALYSGLISEFDFCKKLNIKAEKIEKYLL